LPGGHDGDAAVMLKGVELLTEFGGNDLADLCDATEAAIEAGGGFGWLNPPPRNVLESYWKGLLLVPQRALLVARLDSVICGSAQLARPARNNEAQAFSAQLQHAFIAPWARGHGLARELTLAVEDEARREGFTVLTLDVRETQEAAIRLYGTLGYVRWGTNPFYARVNGSYVVGYHYYKPLDAGVTTAGVEAGRKRKAGAKAKKPHRFKAAAKAAAKSKGRAAKKDAPKKRAPKTRAGSKPARGKVGA
jgi:ribosomal protein S18 acetylase RimI-like enzyme